jgi:hypothetical protein
VPVVSFPPTNVSLGGGSGSGLTPRVISISLETLTAILKWAKGE